MSQSPWPTSLWRHLALSDPNHAAFVGYGPLERDQDVEVAVIGAGYSGLSAAYELRKRGVSCLIVDAARVGWAASGRNGGVVMPEFRQTFAKIAKRHGTDMARKMHRLAHESVETVKAFVDEFGIKRACLELKGSIQCAHTERALSAVELEAEWFRRELKDPSFQVLSRNEIADETGSTGFVGGMLYKAAGTILPYEYARGLATGVVGLGVPLFEETPVWNIQNDQRPGFVTLHTPHAVVNARQMIVATDAYSSLTPSTDPWRRELIPFRSAIIATERLPESIDLQILRYGRSYTETRRMMKWFRKADGRMLFGGRDAFGREGQSTGFDALRKAMVELFPCLSGIKIEFQWSGYVSLTMDGLPHVGRYDDKIVYCLGYNGAGIAMASLIGRHAAALALKEEPELALLRRPKPQPIPCYPMVEPGVRMMAAYYQFLDRLGV